MGAAEDTRVYPHEKNRVYSVKPKGIPFGKQDERITMGTFNFLHEYLRKRSEPYMGKARGTPLNEQISVLGTLNIKTQGEHCKFTNDPQGTKCLTTKKPKIQSGNIFLLEKLTKHLSVGITKRAKRRTHTQHTCV